MNALQSVLEYFKSFYRDVVLSLTEPRRFFTERYPQTSFNHSLAFGLTAGWIGAAIEFWVRVVNQETLLDGFLKIRDQLMQLPVWKDLPTSMWAQEPAALQSMFPAWLAEASAVALFPFSYLVKLIFMGAMLWFGGFLFLPRPPVSASHSGDPRDFSHWAKLTAACSGPLIISAILGFLPLGLGALAGFIYGWVILLIGISTRYQVSTLRAFAIVITPGFLITLVGTCFFTLLGGMLFAALVALF